VLGVVEARHAAWADRIGRAMPLVDLRQSLRGLIRARELLEADAQRAKREE
jgi:hypothetical protein